MAVTGNAYNIYAKIASLACVNVHDEVCRLSMLKPSDVTVRVRGRDNAVDLTDKISRDAQGAAAKYSDAADKLLVIRSEEPMVRMLTAGRIFVESVLSSRSARIAQRRLSEYGAAERFLKTAYSIDRRKPAGKSVSALTRAKDIVAKAMGLAALGAFDFDRGEPVLDPAMKHDLEGAAFDPKFSFMKRDSLVAMTAKKYDAIFAAKERELTASTPVPLSAIKAQKVSEIRKNPPPISAPETPATQKSIMFGTLWAKSYVDLPSAGRRRKLVNLRAKFDGIASAPMPLLAGFRQAAQVESVSKHDFIMNYYNDCKPADYEEPDMSRYLFRMENDMYRAMWGSKAVVRYSTGKLLFPTGEEIAVPAGMKPHDFFHKVNAVYAALFGCESSDLKGGQEWLWDSVRKAYTDEGMADYRLALIGARLEGRPLPGRKPA